MKILTAVLTAATLLVPAHLALNGLRGQGPLKVLGERRLKKMPGNGPEYGFSGILPLENSPLAGKSLCVLGSSVAFGAASLGWAVGEYLSARLGCALTKEAVSGTTLADVGPDSYVNRMKTKLDPHAHFDLFLCQLSTNDASQGVPLGETAAGFSPDEFDPSTVTGALETIISYARETWGCPVAFFTGSRFDFPAYAAMTARLLGLRDKWGVWVLDLWNGEAFNRLPTGRRALYMADGVHPTMAGYRGWWGPELEKQLLACLSKASAGGNPPVGANCRKAQEDLEA